MWGLSTWNTVYVFVLIRIYVIFNVVGTVFYAKLRKLGDLKQVEKDASLTLLIVGWLLWPFANLLGNVLMYNVHKAN